MPADRFRLHLSKIGDFAAWAETQRFVREPIKGVYEVLRLRGPGGGPPLIWFRREGCDHATTPYRRNGQVDPSKLVGRWLRERRNRDAG